MSALTTSRRETVLVVTETPETHAFLTDMLDHAGFTVLIATDGEAALDLCNQITPDLVLMETLTPGFTGFETCKRLKQDKLMAHLPVIFITGLSETEQVVAGLASGGVDYVSKPIDLEELLARIQVHLGNARRTYEAYAALDASGKFFFATDRAGHILWCTPKARQLLTDSGTTPVVRLGLPADVLEQLLRFRHSDASGSAHFILMFAGRQFDCLFVSPLGSNEFLFRLAECQDGDADKMHLQRAYSLTARQAEVLLWISHGKSNRDIGQILEISPRTVNKHVQQVFDKLGVANRAAASAKAVRSLTR